MGLFGDDDQVVGALYTHGHFDHVGGAVPTKLTGGIRLQVEGLRELVERGLSGVSQKNVRNSENSPRPLKQI